MAYSATLANIRGQLSDTEYRRVLHLFSRAGLSMDHHQFDDDLLDKGTKAILKTRDGKLRAAIPSPLGKCVFLNDVGMDELYAALRKHKEVMLEFPRRGEGIDASVDASDTGYTMNEEPIETKNGASKGPESVTILTDDTRSDHEVNGLYVNGRAKEDVNGHQPHQVKGDVRKQVNGINGAIAHASGPEGVDGLQRGNIDGILNGNN